jgi:enoyl-CoA hydratase/carnithine racemase
VAAVSDLPSYRTILMEVDRGVATVTLNRPRQRNAVGGGMREDLAGVDGQPHRSDQGRVV